MASAHDETPDWGEAEGSPTDQPQSSSISQEQAMHLNKPHVRRIEMMRIHDEGEDEEDDDESHHSPCEFAQQLQNVRESFEPPSPRSQTDLSGAVPRMP